MNGNPLHQVNEPLDVLKRKILVKFLAKFSLVSHSQRLCSCVYANNERQNDRIPLQSLSLFYKAKYRVTHILQNLMVVWSCFTVSLSNVNA